MVNIIIQSTATWLSDVAASDFSKQFKQFKEEEDFYGKLYQGL